MVDPRRSKMWNNIIGVLIALILVVWMFTDRKTFFGTMLAIASIYLTFSIVEVTGFPKGGPTFFGVIIALFGMGCVIFLWGIILMYTFGIGKIINIFLAITAWLSIYFEFITMNTGFLKVLLIYLTVAGIASMFVMDISLTEDDSSEPSS